MRAFARCAIWLLVVAAAPACGHRLPAAVTSLPAAAVGSSATDEPDTAAGARIERTVHAMGTLLRIDVAAESDGAGAAALEAAFVEVDRLERVLSSWRTDSEVGVLNAAAGAGPVELTPELAMLLLEAGEHVAATGGAFDPAIGSLIDAWQLRGPGRVPSSVSLTEARRRSGWHLLRLDGSSTTATAGPAGWWIDTGAFGKGVALGAAAGVLRERGVEDAVLDFGGQLLVLGDSTDVAVADPRDRETPLAVLRVSNASVSTTAASERFVVVDGVSLGHVLDPRTGVPVPAWGSVTVVVEDAVRADALSTALFVMGPDAALEWAADREDVAVLALRLEAGAVKATWNRAMQPMLVHAPNDE